GSMLGPVLRVCAAGMRAGLLQPAPAPRLTAACRAAAIPCDPWPTPGCPAARCCRERKTMSITRVVPNVVSDTPDASRSFYAGLLGFEVAMDMGWIMTFVSPTNPTAQISIIRSDATAPVVRQISVEAAPAAPARAVRRAPQIVHPLPDERWGVRRFFVIDPNGVVLNVVSPRESFDLP